MRGFHEKVNNPLVFGTIKQKNDAMVWKDITWSGKSALLLYLNKGMVG